MSAGIFRTHITPPPPTSVHLLLQSAVHDQANPLAGLTHKRHLCLDSETLGTPLQSSETPEALVLSALALYASMSTAFDSFIAAAVSIV